MSITREQSKSVSRASQVLTKNLASGKRFTPTTLAKMCVYSFFVMLFTALGGAGSAQAQAVDWVVNLDDIGSDPNVAGGTINYNLRVDNNGFSAAPATTVTLLVAQSTQLLTVTGGLTGCAPVPTAVAGVGGITVTCNVPALASSASVAAVLAVRTTVQGTTGLRATVPNAGDGNTANNTRLENTTVNAGADFSLAINGPATAVSGGNVSYDLVATNNGPNTATSFTYSFPIPAGLTNVAPPAGCSLAGSTYSCVIAGPIAAGASVTRTFTGQVSAAGGSTVTPVGSVIGVSPTDPLPANNTATTSTTIDAGSDVTIAKNRSPGGVLLVGAPVTFTLSPSFTGDSPTGLTVTDTFPANYTIGTITAPGWSCSKSGQTVTCTRPSGPAAGANVSLGDISIAAVASSAGTVTNTATVASTGPADPNPGNNSANDGGVTITPAVVDLSANKSGPSPALVVVGNSYNFSISMSNVGNAPFFGTAVMTDTLPTGLTVTAYAQNGWTCTPAPNVAGPAAITCTRVYTAGAPLASGDTTPSVGLTTLATGTGNISNRLTVSSPDANIADTNPANDTITYDVTGSSVAGSADITVRKTAALPSVVAGDVQTFVIEVVNAGPSASTNVTMSDSLTSLINSSVGPTGAGFIDVVPTPRTATLGACNTSGSGTTRDLSCAITTLPVCVAGSTCPTYTVRVRPGGEAGSRTNTAFALSTVTGDPNLGNNNGSANFSVTPRVDVTVVKTATPPSAIAGQNLSYVVAAQNIGNGLSSADNVTVTDTLPANLVFISASPSSGSCSAVPAANSITGPGNNAVTCNLGTIANSAQQTITIVVRPRTGTLGSTLTNAASVTTSTPEPNTANNSTTLDTPVTSPALDLQVQKTESVDPLAVGDLTVYSMTITNNGPSAAENVVMTDTMPPSRISYQSFTVPASGSCSTIPAVNSFSGTLTCTFASIPAGESRVVTITARGEAKGTATNAVSITSTEIAGGYDTDPLNNADDEDTTVRTKADVQVVSKTPGSPTVNVRDVFNYVVVVRNNTGAGLAEADDVLLTDNLPSNMVLAGGPTALVASGTASATACTGAAGDTAFTCNLGTMSSGAVVNVTLPVRITAVTSLPQTFTNAASVATSSLDINPANNSNSGDVAVNSSSLAGTVFFDFNNNGAINGPGDTGLGGILMTLAGTTVDGKPFSTTTPTLGDGTYKFNFVPQGNYTVTRGPVSTPNVVDGINTQGSEGGNPATPTTITTIALPANTAATAYLFAVVPTARVGIAKAVQTGPTANADGSFNVTFRLNVTNLSLEPLNAMQVSDPLAGAAPLFGTQATVATPATSPLARGSYTMLSAPAGSCGGLNGGFNGGGAQVAATGFTLAAGASCSIDIALRVQPTVPLPPILASGGRYENQATVIATGAFSGQTSATNPQLTDLSDSGTTVDPSGNGLANEPDENDPTPVIPSYTADIRLTKTADISALSNPPLAGETITFRFEISNVGDVTLAPVTLTDPLPGLTVLGGPIASLAPGAVDSDTFTATYQLTQDDVDAGQVTNRAQATGTDPFDQPIDDFSGTTINDDDFLVTSLLPDPTITLIKEATPAFSTPPAVNDTISYKFTVQNTGNVRLSGVTLTDLLPGIVISGGPIPVLEPNEIDSSTFTAVYTLTQADLDALQVVNSATVTGTPPVGLPVTDTSGTTAGDDIPTVVPIAPAQGITLVKTADDTDFLDGPNATDRVRYSFAITNTGNVTLTGITLSDILPGIVISGGPIASLAPGATDNTTFTAVYAPTPADLAVGTVDNTATATGFYGPVPVRSVADSDTVTARVVGIDAISEVFPPFATNGGTTTSMLASDLLRGGPATLANVAIRVVATDPQLTLNPATGLITLAPDSPAGTYTVTYEICSIAPPTICDQAIETVVQLPLPAIEVTKTQTVVDNGDGVNGVGDRVDYTITVENTGNTPLVNLVLVDTLTSLAGTPLALDAGPTFGSASLASPEGDLLIDEIATYTASYTLTIQTVSDGGISNTVTGTALPVFGPGVLGVPAPISDVSDDGIDGDGDTVGDPTVLAIASSLAPSGLTVTKTTPRGVVQRGSVVPYTITVENRNPVVSGTLNIVDALPPGFLYVPGSATLGGVAYPVTVSGRIVTWNNVPVPPLTTVTATISARVLTGAQAGEHINVANILNPTTGARLARAATATVRILPEPVFDCGDVVGKVFDDKNRDGYQTDGGPEPITEDVYDPSGKYSKYGAAPEVVTEYGEPGIPGVRLVGVDGTIITTDQYGRYHVPCAMLPADGGSNFILKLDTRSLPSGYRLTTENPRVVRLTKGKMSKMNFGASITKVVRVDLNARAFVAGADGNAALSPGLVSGIEKLLPQIAGEPTNLRLSYHLPKAADSADEKRARNLMRLVERHIQKQWRKIGRVKLTIEKTIVRAGE